LQEPNDPETRVGQLEQMVERLTSEVASLRLELATLVSAVREIQSQQLGRRLPAGGHVNAIARHKPSAVPAGLVVLVVSGLLSWQVLIGPRGADEAAATRVEAPAGARARDERPALPAAIPEPAIAKAEPQPTIYRGTLSIDAAQPSAEVFVNRHRVGTAPVRVRNLKAGSHLVWVESEGYRRWTRVITVPAETVTRVSADLQPLVDRTP